jgi:hypothetical protein
MKTEYTFNLTPRANEKAASLGMTTLRFASEAPLHNLQPGDLFSTEETLPLVFVVMRRHFHLVASDHLQIETQLDLQY